MKEKRKGQRQAADGARDILPALPLNDDIGRRLQDISDVFEALDKVKGIHLHLQDEETRALAAELDVPVLYLCLVYDGAYLLTNDDDVTAYVRWRQGIAREAVQ